MAILNKNSHERLAGDRHSCLFICFVLFFNLTMSGVCASSLPVYLSHFDDAESISSRCQFIRTVKSSEQDFNYLQLLVTR